MKIKEFQSYNFSLHFKDAIWEREQLDLKRKIYEYFPLGAPSSAS